MDNGILCPTDNMFPYYVNCFHLKGAISDCIRVNTFGMNFDLSSMGLCLGRGKSTRRCCTVFAYTGDTKNLAICNIYHCNHFLRLLARSIITSIIFVCNVACDLYKWLPATFDNRKQISNSLNYSTVCDELCMSRYIIFLLKLYALKCRRFNFNNESEGIYTK